MHNRLIGLTLIFLLLLLISCGATPTKIVRDVPPAILLADCDFPVWAKAEAKNEDLLTFIKIDLQKAHAVCNAGKAELRNYFSSPEK